MTLKDYFLDRKMLNRVFIFQCFSDKVISFSTQEGDYMVEVNIISDDFFTSEMKGEDIVNMKNITYYDFSIYKIEEPKLTVIERIEYNG